MSKATEHSMGKCCSGEADFLIAGGMSEDLRGLREEIRRDREEARQEHLPPTLGSAKPSWWQRLLGG